MRCFEKISFEQFKKDIANDEKLYASYDVPKRQTKSSAGYDFESLMDFTLMPGESKKIPLGIKAKMNEDEFLMIIIRSSLGFKYNIRMCNQVGIIDSDYYNNSNNEGHIFVKLYNEGKEKFCVNKKDRLCQGIFTKFLTVSNEEKINNVRTNGFGSTGKGE